MGATTGQTGMLATLEMGDGASPEVFTDVANIVSMNVGGVSLATVDATHLGSPNGYSEVKPTLKRPEEWTITLQWDPNHATQDGTTGLRKKLEDRTLTNFRFDPLLAGVSKGVVVAAYVTQIGNVTVESEGMLTQQITITPNGKPVEYTPV
jgi:tail tube protein